MHGSLIQCSVTQEARGHGFIPAAVDDFIDVLGSKRESGPQWTLGTDDAVSTVHVVVLVEEVHRAALALGTSIDSSEELSETDLGIQASGECMPMIPVGGDHRIGRSHCGDTTYGDRFLTVVDVQETSGEFVLVRLH